jgi:REP element-mobilizing transposase RayT
MPRQARIDAPGTLQHIIVRGIERRKLFGDDADREVFLERLGQLLQESGTTCCAWTLMPTHVHLLLQTGTVPVATLTRRLLTGYAVTFNRRHRRHGPLFQNRYIKRDIACAGQSRRFPVGDLATEWWAGSPTGDGVSHSMSKGTWGISETSLSRRRCSCALGESEIPRAAARAGRAEPLHWYAGRLS